MQPLKPLLISGIEKIKITLDELTRQYSELPFDPDKVTGMFLPGLLQKCTARLNRVLALEINVARLEGRLEGETPQARFTSFLNALQKDDAMLTLLAEYPVLARQLTIVTNNWANTTGEFLTRLAGDRRVSWKNSALKIPVN